MIHSTEPRMRTSGTLLSATFAAVGIAFALAATTAKAAPNPTDTVRLREQLKQKFVELESGTWSVRDSASLVASAEVNFPGVAPGSVDDDTVLQFRVGTYEFARRLGDLMRHRPGATFVTFVDDDGLGMRVVLRARVRPGSDGGTRLQLRLRASGVPLVCDAERAGETGVRILPLDAAVRLGDGTVNFAGQGPADVVTRTLDVLGAPVPLSRIRYLGEAAPVVDTADPVDPTLEITSPLQDGVISGNVVTLTGFARDDQSLASLRVSLNGAPPADVPYTTRDGAGGLGSVEADISAVLAVAEGTNSCTVVVTDVAGNSAQRTFTFVYSVPRTVSASVGTAHSLFVVDGALYGCGRNTWGQCGDGTRDAKSTPTLATGLTGVAAVAAGGNHSLVLLGDGSVLAMGENKFGELGDGTHVIRDVPTPVSGLGSGVVAVAAGPHHSIAVKADGTVWAWGSNAVGLFGTDIGNVNGTIDLPRQVEGIDDAVDVATGVYHSVILASDGTVWTLGSNANGQLGSASGYPTGAHHVAGVSGVTSVSAGAYYTLARHGDGTVSGWGSNDTLVLGPTRGTQRLPATVPDLFQVTSLTSGYFYSLFLDADGGLRVRGNLGQLTGPTGVFETDTVPTTTSLDVLDDVVAAWATDHSAILQRGDGTLWGLGVNNWGQLGNGSTSQTFVTTADRVLLPE